MTFLDYVKAAADEYKAVALWSETDGTEGGTSLVERFDVDDLHSDTETEMERDVTSFIESNWDVVKDLDPYQVGGDFLLTRNGHGTGFWDRTYKGGEEIGRRLTDESKPYGSYSLYIGDDGQIHGV